MRGAPGLLLVGIVLLLAAAPQAAAQGLQREPSLTIEPLEWRAAVDPGDAQTVEVRVTYSISPPDPLAMRDGVRVALAVEGLPWWLRAAPEPEEQPLYLAPDARGSATGEATFLLHLGVAKNVSRTGDQAVLLVHARSDASTFATEAERSAPILIQVKRDDLAGGGGGAMPAPADPRATTPPAVTPARDDGHATRAPLGAPDPDLRLQSNQPAKGFSGGETLLVALFGVGGAYAGHRLRARF